MILEFYNECRHEGGRISPYADVYLASLSSDSDLGVSMRFTRIGEILQDPPGLISPSSNVLWGWRGTQGGRGREVFFPFFFFFFSCRLRNRGSSSWEISIAIGTWAVPWDSWCATAGVQVFFLFVSM